MRWPTIDRRARPRGAGLRPQGRRTQRAVQRCALRRRLDRYGVMRLRLFSMKLDSASNFGAWARVCSTYSSEPNQPACAE